MRTLATVLLLLITPFSPAQSPRPQLPAGVTVNRNLEYGPHERNKLDLYLPPGDGPRPLIIWVHGGGWMGGSKDGGNPALPFLTKGYAVAAINYRLSQHGIFPAQIEDCKDAVRWLRANAKKYNLDSDNFGAWGASAGGHLVALLGTADEAAFPATGPDKKYSSAVQAVCDWFGPTDFSKEAEEDPHSAIDRTKPDCPEAKLIGGLLAEHPDRVKRANPITYVSKTSAPFLIVHGDKDNLVPVEQSRMLNDALKKAGVESKLIVVPGAGHGNGIGTPDQMRQIAAFFDEHLKKGK